MHCKRASERGFGLVQILVAVGIVAVLSTVVMVNIGEVRKKSRDTQRMSDISQLQVALKLYNDSYGSYVVSSVPDGGAVSAILNGCTGPSDECEYSLSDVVQILHGKGYLPVSRLVDPSNQSGTNGYRLFVCESVGRYALYAKKEISQPSESARVEQLCGGIEAISGGTNYGVGN